jgi:hypothetical protein
MRFRSLLMAMGMVALASGVGAQVDSPTGRIRIPYRTYLGLNPLGIPFDIFSFELESGIAQGMTLGAVASRTDLGDDRFSSADLKFRYYPSEVVLSGFSVGASVGVLRYTTKTGILGARESLDAPTFGVLVDYNWMLGARHRFIVGTGVGAKRLLVSSAERERVGLERAQLTARFTLGVAF